jgi:hypothetical protein
LPLLPLLSVPRFFLCIARLTSFEADLEYFRAMGGELLVSRTMNVELHKEFLTCGNRIG